MADALEELTGKANPDILLVTLGPLVGPIFEQIFSSIAEEGVVVIVAAGNNSGEPAPFEGTAVENQLMVLASVDLRGQPSPFTQSNAMSYWAPGENIPVYKPVVTDRTEPVKGTTYAASLAAGLVARALAEHPNVKLDDLLRTLKETSKAAEARTEPGILNLEATLKALNALAESG